MEKLKKVGRIIGLFIVMLFICIFPALLIGEDEAFLLFRQPIYWAITLFIAIIDTFMVEHSDDSNN